MKNASRVVVMKCKASIAAVGAVWLLTGLQVNAGNWKGDLQGGAGYWAGDATYSIGGEAWTSDGGTEKFADKISELTFPLDIVYGSLGGSLQWKERLEINGAAMANLTDPSTKATDSDWGIFSDDNTLDVYSKTDAELTAIAADVGVRYWFRRATSTNRFVWSVGAGPSVLYQHLDWTLSTLDQWSPSHPQYGHDYESGQVGTYKSDIVMPYVNVNAIIKVKRVSGRLEIGVGPAVVQDEVDHILRQKRSTGDMDGVGVKGAAEIRYDVTKHLFTLARVTALSIQATGTQTQKGYGGDLAGFSGKIDEEFSLTSINGGAAVGFAF